MAQSIQSSKFGTLDTSGRVPVSLTGVGTDPALGMGLSFNVGGRDYTFIPEDRVTQGAASGSSGALFTGFLNPDLLANLKNSSDYVDLSGVNFGSFDAGNFVNKNMGGSTKGFLAPKEVVDPILSAGITQYDTSFAGRPTGIGNANGKPAYILPSGYADDSGKVTKTETKLVGYKYSNGGGLLAGLGNEILKAGPILPIALDFAVPGLGTAVAGGVAAGSLATGDTQNALRYGAQYAAGTLGAGGAQPSAGTATGAYDAGIGLDAMSGGPGLASVGTGAGLSALDANMGTYGAAASMPEALGGGAAALPAAVAMGGPDLVANAGAALPTAASAAAPAAAAAIPSWMTPAAIVGSSLIGANAAQEAAKTQADAATQANQLLAAQYQQQRADLAPFTQAGLGAQNKLLTYFGLPGGTQGADYGKYAKDFGIADFTVDPGYAFRLSEGQKALERSAAARGGLLSGGTGKALTSYGQQMGSQEYQNAFNRYQTNRANQLAPLFTLTGSGQASAANQAAAAGNYGTGAANNLTSAGAANAAGTVGSVNALTGGLNSYLNYANQQDLLAAYNARTAAAKSAYS